MKLIIIILALLALRYIHVGRSEQRYTWLLSYANSAAAWLQKRGVKNATLVFFLLILPILGVLYALQFITVFWAFGLLSFFVNLALLWFALWPVSAQQLEVEGFHPDKETDTVKSVLIDQSGEMLTSGTSQQRSRDYSKRLLVEANQNTFAVIFWFLVAGGYGAILYRFINLLYRKADQLPALTTTHNLLRTLQQIFDWIPARLVALTYVLAGDFDPGFHSWRQYAGKNLDSTDHLLAATGLSAAGRDPNNATQADIEENRQLIRLVDRTLIVWLFLIAIFVIGRVMY